MKVFVSYSHQDKKWASLIAERLQEAGHEVWIDSWKTKIGDNLLKKLKKALDQQMP